MTSTRLVFRIFLQLLIIIAGIGLIFWSGVNRLTSQELVRFDGVGSYTACSCGCCEGVDPVRECLYYARQDDIREVIRQDVLRKWPGWTCSVAGCSRRIVYAYCDEPSGE